MKYFKTGNASRPYHVGGQAIYFESVHRNGAGSLRGIFATDNEALAAQLVFHGPPIHQISEEEYLTEKKKATLSSPQSNFKPVGPQLRSQAPATATPAAEPPSAKKEAEPIPSAKEAVKGKSAEDLVLEDMDVPDIDGGADKPKGGKGSRRNQAK